MRILLVVEHYLKTTFFGNTVLNAFFLTRTENVYKTFSIAQKSYLLAAMSYYQALRCF